MTDTTPTTEVKPRATRDAFGETLERLGGDEPRLIVMDADLSGSTRSERFAKAYPERFFEMGIQEANMISTAAGLALSGKVVFCCSFSAFVTSRFDQIKVSVAYNDANVRIVGTHAGSGVGPDGYTQMALEDVAMLRSLPNMAVFQPADDVEATAIVEYLVREHSGPAFLRLTRQKVPRIHDPATYRFVVGVPEILREGSDLQIFTTGACVAGSIEAAMRLKGEGYAVGVANVASLAPLDFTAVSALAVSTEKVLTVEDHGVVGGLGSAICEALAETTPRSVRRVALREFGESGSTEALYAKHHLDVDGIYLEAKRYLEG